MAVRESIWKDIVRHQPSPVAYCAGELNGLTLARIVALSSLLCPTEAGPKRAILLPLTSPQARAFGGSPGGGSCPGGAIAAIRLFTIHKVVGPRMFRSWRSGIDRMRVPRDVARLLEAFTGAGAEETPGVKHRGPTLKHRQVGVVEEGRRSHLGPRAVSRAGPAGHRRWRSMKRIVVGIAVRNTQKWLLSWLPRRRFYAVLT